MYASKILRLSMILAATLVGSHPAIGQEAFPPDSPEPALQAFFEELEREDWEAAARRLDVEALARWHRGVVGRFEWARGRPTVEDFLSSDPGMPRSAAEYQASRVAAGPDKDVQRWYAGFESVEELRSMEPLEAAARRLEARSPEHRKEIQAGFPPAMFPPGHEPRGEGRMALWRPAVLAGIGEEEESAYVVYLDRWVDPLEELNPMSMGVDVVSLSRVGDAWAIDPEEFLSIEGSMGGMIWGEPHPHDFPEPEPVAAGSHEAAESVVRELFEALAEDRWDAAAALYDPQGLEGWHRSTLEGMDTPTEPLTVERILAFDPEMPREVAEYQAERARRTLGTPERTQEDRYARVRTTEELRPLTPREAAARFLEAMDPEYRRELVARRYAARLSPEEHAALERAPMPDRRREVLGSVAHLDGIHVVYSVVPAGESPSNERGVWILEVRRTGEGWRAHHFGVWLLPEEPISYNDIRSALRASSERQGGE